MSFGNESLPFFLKSECDDVPWVVFNEVLVHLDVWSLERRCRWLTMCLIVRVFSVLLGYQDLQGTLLVQNIICALMHFLMSVIV